MRLQPRGPSGQPILPLDTAGSYIYGGGQVVLPLLLAQVTRQSCTTDAAGSQVCVDAADSWVTTPQFLAGLGLVQALPGPLFNFSAYLGTIAALRTGYPFILGKPGVRGAGVRRVTRESSSPPVATTCRRCSIAALQGPWSRGSACSARAYCSSLASCPSGSCCAATSTTRGERRSTCLP